MSADVNIVVGAEDRATKVLNSVASSVGSLGGTFAALGPAVAGIGASLAGLAAGFITVQSAINGTVEAANKIDALTDVATGLGASVPDLQAFQFAMSEAGNVDAGQSIQALQKMQRLVGDIAGGENEKASELFEKLGLDAKALSMQGPVDQFLAVKQAISGIENVSERASVAQQLLGKSASDLIPALISQQDEFNASMEAAKDLGLTVSEEGAAGIASMNDALGRVSAGFEGIYNQVAVAVAPAVQAIADTIATWLPPIIDLAIQYLPTIVDALVAGAGYAVDLAKAMTAIATLDFDAATAAVANLGQTSVDWLNQVNQRRADAADAAKANAERAAAMATANLQIESDITKEKEKQQTAAERAIADLERQVRVAQIGEKAAKQEEQLATAANDAERERIALLQRQLDQQNAINDANKAFAEQEKKAQEEAKKRQEQEAKEAADKQAALSRPAAVNTATESRLLTRGRSDQGIDSIAKNSEKQVGILGKIAQLLERDSGGTPGLAFTEIG